MKQIRKQYSACGLMLLVSKFGAVPAVLLVIILGRGLAPGLSSALGNMLAYVPLACALVWYTAVYGMRSTGIARPRAADVLCGFLLALPMSLSASLFAHIGDAAFGGTGMSEGVIALVRDSGMFLPFASLAAVPAICEELLVRGALYTTARSRSAWWALLVSSLAFAGMHGSLSAIFYTFYCGLVLGLARELTGSVWCGLCSHFGFNSLTVLSAMSASGGGAGTAGSAMGPDAMTVAVWLSGIAGCAVLLMVLKRLHRNDPPAETDPSVPYGSVPFYAFSLAAVFGPALLGIG